jgi:O-methyltransferase
VGAHRNTAAQRVLSVLAHPERAVLRQGLFPSTAAGLEGERFALVSLDADLEESTLAGLRWFLPRMNEGGYLLLHDYNNPKLPGVRRAVERFETEAGRLRAVPLCDVNGTLVIST